MEVPIHAGVKLELGVSPVTRGSLYVEYAGADGRLRWARIPSFAKGYQAFRIFIRRILGKQANLASWQG